MSTEQFDVNIYPEQKSRGFDWKAIWQYRDMILLLVRRDYVAGFKQTILGPLWAVVEPVVSTAVTAFVFGNLAGLSPSGVPTFIFYMAGQIAWGYFSRCLNSTTNIFLNNSGLMSKIFFPRIVISVSSALSALIQLLIHAAIFTFFYIFYLLRGVRLTPDLTALLIPVYVLHLALIGIGAGSILSALTTKYRDTVKLINYLFTLWMYLTPVVYDLSIVPERFRGIYMLNPVTPVFVHIRYALFRTGTPCWNYYALSIVVAVLLLFIGGRVFSKVERNFIDTI